MTGEPTPSETWWSMADEALASAGDDVGAGRLRRAVNGAYYACFYAATARLAAEGRSFSKHTAVQAALHRDWVRTGRLERRWGELYNELFDARHMGDYHGEVTFAVEQVQHWVAEAMAFADRLRGLAAPDPGE